MTSLFPCLCLGFSFLSAIDSWPGQEYLSKTFKTVRCPSQADFCYVSGSLWLHFMHELDPRTTFSYPLCAELCHCLWLYQSRCIHVHELLRSHSVQVGSFGLPQRSYTCNHKNCTLLSAPDRFYRWAGMNRRRLRSMLR